MTHLRTLEKHAEQQAGKAHDKPEPHFPEATSCSRECGRSAITKGWVCGERQISKIYFSGASGLVFDLRYPLIGSGFNGIERNVPERYLRWSPPHRHWYKEGNCCSQLNARGTWYTASVVCVHTDGSNSVDVKFDDGRTVGRVHGPAMMTRVPHKRHIQQVQWYIGQPVLAQFSGEGCGTEHTSPKLYQIQSTTDVQPRTIRESRKNSSMFSMKG